MQRLADNVTNKATKQLLAVSTIKREREMLIPGFDLKVNVYSESLIYPGGTTGPEAAFGRKPVAIIHNSCGAYEGVTWDDFHQDLVKACKEAQVVTPEALLAALEKQHYLGTITRKRQLLLGFQEVAFIAVFDKR